MQTKSQNAQNPGLWVNGNRMPVQESLLGAAIRGIGKVANFGYGLGNNLGNGMMNAANIAVSGLPLKPYPQPSPGLRSFDPNDHSSRGQVRPEDFIRPRPSPSPRPDDRYVPRPARPRFPDYNPGFDPTKAPGSPFYTPGPGDPGYRPRLPGFNPKPKSPTDITVDDIINPNTGNVSLSTGEANKPGAVTLYPAGQNILNPPAKSKSGLGDIIDRPGLPKRKPDLMRPGTPEYTEMQRRIMEPIKRWEQENPDQHRYGAEKPERIDRTIGKDVGGSLGYRRLKPYNTLNSSGEPLGIIPPTDPNLMNRMY
jgi:hypothetical protein